MTWPNKIKEWLKRYGLAEVLGTLSAIGAFQLAQALHLPMLLVAYVAACGENLGFYGTMLWRQVCADRADTVAYRLPDFLRTTLTLLLEFGPAEVLDTTLSRPLCIVLGVQLAGSVWGVFAGKLLGDVVFYLPVILTYELRKRATKRLPQG